MSEIVNKHVRILKAVAGRGGGGCVVQNGKEPFSPVSGICGGEYMVGQQECI